jgi:hypothetical protein
MAISGAAVFPVIAAMMSTPVGSDVCVTTCGAVFTLLHQCRNAVSRERSCLCMRKGFTLIELLVVIAIM